MYILLVPSSITHLIFDLKFNQLIYNLQTSVTHLTFYSNSFFNYPIVALPPSITHLIFGYEFNHPVNYIPPKLQVLKCSTKNIRIHNFDNLGDLKVITY